MEETQLDFPHPKLLSYDLNYKKVENPDEYNQNNPNTRSQIEQRLGLIPVLGRGIGDGNANNQDKGKENERCQGKLEENRHDLSSPNLIRARSIK
jgi:hypothetical protein